MTNLDVSNFIVQALRGDDLTIYGDGDQTRSFCFVDDLVEGIFKLLHSDYSGPVNLGNPDEVSILEFAKEVIQLTGTNKKIIFKDLPKDDPTQRQPDISKALKILKWSPKTSRSKGLMKTYHAFQKLSLDELNKQEHRNFKEFTKI